MALPAASWVETGAAKARATLVPKLDPALQAPAEASINRIVQGKDAIGPLANLSFARVTSWVSLGQDAEARRTWVRERASYEERQAVLVGGAQAAFKSHADEEAAWQEVKAIALDILKYLGPVAFQLLMAMA